MDWQIQRLWDELTRQLNFINAIKGDVSAHTDEIEEMKKRLRSEAAKRGWEKRRINKMQADISAMRADISALITQVAALQAAKSTDENAAREILEKVQGHLETLH